MKAQEQSGGVLYLVATPIGNLEDITLRALRILKDVDAIACEDTRQTQKLLNHYGSTTRTVSYHEHNEMTRAAELLLELEEGAKVALVSDAGMPAISDPGYRLIALAIRHGIPVVPIPGASAFVAALAASGLPTDSFRFGGFLPAKRGARRKELEQCRDSPRTQIYYEAPHRLQETLADLVEVMGPERQVVIAREVTTMHEEFLRGHAGDLLRQLAEREVKGEITLLIRAEENAGAGPVAVALPQQKSIRSRLQEVMQERQLDEKAALKVVARERGVSKSEAYRELQRSPR